MKKAVKRERSISVKQYKESNVAHWLQLNWRRLLRVEVIVFVVLCLILLYNGFQLARCKWMATRPRQAYYKALFDSKKDDIIDFEGFNNRFSTSDQKLIVPNIIHLLFLNQTEMRFHEMICIFSMFLNQKPDTIMIHCENCSFTGYYWNKLNKFKALSSIIKFNTLPVKRGIYGKLSNTIRYALNHRADFWRLMILMKYGGIYLDNDVYVISSLDHYRKFEMTVGMENANSGVTIGNQVILAHRNARLLKAMFDTYRYDYQQNEWYYNGGYLPGVIINQTRSIAHVVQFELGTAITTDWLYDQYVKNYANLFKSWHLMYNHRWYINKESYARYPEYNETVIWRDFNYTFAEMCRDVLSKMNLYL